MPARGTRNRFRVNHFIDENTESKYTEPYYILTDGLVFYTSYFVMKVYEYNTKSSINNMLSNIKKCATIVRRDDDNDNYHTTEFSCVDRTCYNGIHLIIVKYNTYEDENKKPELIYEDYTFSNESRERAFCKLLSSNLKLLKSDPDKYDDMRNEYLGIY